MSTSMGAFVLLGAVSISSMELPPGCWCSCPAANFTVTNEELEIRKKEILSIVSENLLVDKESLSATKRKKLSVSDNRISAKTVGYTGVVTLTLVFLTLIWMDASYISNFAISLGVNLKTKTT